MKPDTESQGKHELALATDTAAIVAEIAVTDAASMDLATNLIATLRDERQRVDALRVHLKAPSLEACRRVDGVFQPAIKRYEALEKDLREKVSGYRARIAAARVKENAAGVVPQAPAEADKASFTRYLVVDIYEPEKVPRIYLVPDIKEIEKALREGTAVAGCRLVEKERLVVR